MKKQMRMFEDGGLEQDGGTVDPASGNKVPMGSAKNEVSDDIPARLSEGEFVFPADVVRYIGLEKLMVMRQKAKEGLKKMNAMGQMGNSDEATIPDDVPFSEADLIMEDEDGNTVEMAEGGSVYNDFMADAGIKQVSYVNTRTGDTTLVYIVNGQPIPALSSEWVPEGQAAPNAVEESIATNAIDTSQEKPEKDSRDQVSFFDGQPVSSGRSIKIRDADDWANLEGEGILGKAVDQSKAPAGWSTQNQREYNKLKAEGLPVEAMWNGNSWDVYTSDSRFKGSPYGAPGHRGFKPKYKNTFGVLSNLNPFANLKDKGQGFKDSMAELHQSYIDGIDEVLGKTVESTSTDDSYDRFMKRNKFNLKAKETETDLKNLGIKKDAGVTKFSAGKGPGRRLKTITPTNKKLKSNQVSSEKEWQKIQDDKEREKKEREAAQKRADAQAKEIKQKREEKFGSSFTRKRDERTWNKGGIVSKPILKRKKI